MPGGGQFLHITECSETPLTSTHLRTVAALSCLTDVTLKMVLTYPQMFLAVT
jgi:hypothetical protein